MQQIPATGSKYAKLIKGCFQAPKGWLWVGLDYASLEDHISALVTKDPNKLKVYTDEYDGHCLRAYSYWTSLMPDITAKLEAETELRNIKRLSSVGGVGGGVLDSSRSVLGQILWNQVDMEMFCEKIGLEDVRNANGKITCKCHCSRRW